MGERWDRGVSAAMGMVLVSASAVWGSLGQLDVGFGRGGVVRTNMGWGGGYSIARTAVQQPDGKLVTAGLGWDESDAFGLVRYLEDGSLDPAFGDGGRVLTQFSTYWLGVDELFGAFGLVLQPDGKLVAAGRAMDERGDMTIVLARYHGTDGSLDESFGVGGRVTTVFPGYQYTTGLVLQPDGRLVVVGTNDGVGLDTRLTRYEADGTLDATFGMGGTVVLDLGEDEEANAVALLPDGKLLVAGRSGSYPDGVVTVVRVTTDGTLDPTFGVGGVARDTATRAGGAFALVTLPDGDIVVAGNALTGNHSDVALVRFLANGALDATFGDAGRVVTPSSGYAVAVAHQADGRLMVTVKAGDDLALIRYAGTGQVEEITTPVIANIVFPLVVSGMQQADGRLVVVGAGGTGIEGDDIWGDMVLRFHADGSPDMGFGGAGVVTTSVAGTRDDLADIMVQTDGKLVAVGSAQRSIYFPNVAVARYLPDGSLDPSFGVRGRAITAISPFDNEAVGVVQQASGKLVVGVNAGANGSSWFGLVRYDVNGTVDPTFGTDGIVLLPGGSATTGPIQQADGKLVLPGSASGDFMLVRFHPDGALDTTFGNGGMIVTPDTERASSALQQDDGKLVVAGRNGSSGIIARYLADGILDASFSSDGRATTGLGRDAYGVMQQADGKLLVTNGDLIARLTTSGLPDTTFSSSGVATGPIWHSALVQVADGTLIGAGQTLASDRQSALAHYRDNGSLDLDFGVSGVIVTPTGVQDSRFRTLRLLPDSRLVAAGNGGSDFTLARYLTQPCGNGRLDVGEQCDDGAFGAGVCCDAQCRWANAGTTCDDGDACTRDGCAPRVGCVHDVGPRTDCVVPERSQLLVKQDANDQRDRLLWKWRGATVPAGALGDPTNTTSYGVCLYAGGTRAGATIPAHIGWQRTGSAGFAFKSQLGAPDGIRKAALRSTAGGTTGLVDGKGANLPDLATPLPLPLTVQLVNDVTDTCVEAVYATATRNDERQLRAKTAR
ncbi:MAG TPA: hypothetical protein VGR62_04400 [Candidatus Binatia bacterium]|jgi:uncharacterized delta-60 repeat protein|nr:hypothetical protein [Candidatus Binatia bacterium]